MMFVYTQFNDVQHHEVKSFLGMGEEKSLISDWHLAPALLPGPGPDTA